MYVIVFSVRLYLYLHTLNKSIKKDKRIIESKNERNISIHEPNRAM